MVCTFDIDCAGKPKIEIAKEAILTLLDQLKPDDKLGIVLFDHRCTVSFPMCGLSITLRLHTQCLVDCLMQLKCSSKSLRFSRRTSVTTPPLRASNIH
jgi:hypothetical protein